MCTTLRLIRPPRRDTSWRVRQRGREFFGQRNCLPMTLSGKRDQGQWRISRACYRTVIRIGRCASACQRRIRPCRSESSDRARDDACDRTGRSTLQKRPAGRIRTRRAGGADRLRGTLAPPSPRILPRIPAAGPPGAPVGQGPARPAGSTWAPAAPRRSGTASQALSMQCSSAAMRSGVRADSAGGSPTPSRAATARSFVACQACDGSGTPTARTATSLSPARHRPRTRSGQKGTGPDVGQVGFRDLSSFDFVSSSTTCRAWHDEGFDTPSRTARANPNRWRTLAWTGA